MVVTNKVHEDIRYLEGTRNVLVSVTVDGVDYSRVDDQGTDGIFIRTADLPRTPDKQSQLYVFEGELVMTPIS